MSSIYGNRFVEHRALVEERNAQACHRMNEPIDRYEAVIHMMSRGVMNFQFWNFIFRGFQTGWFVYCLKGQRALCCSRGERCAVAVDLKISDYKHKLWLVLWRETEKTYWLVFKKRLRDIRICASFIKRIQNKRAAERQSNKSFENVAKLKHLATKLTDRNLNYEESERKFKSG